MQRMGNILKVAVIGFAGVWIINRALEKAGMSQFKA